MILALAAIAVLISLIDALAAARVERALSRDARAYSSLAAEPESFVDGVPFAQVILTGKVPRLSVQALDVDVPGVGIANARTDVHRIIVPAEKAFAGDFLGAPADIVEHTLSLDGVAFGQLLGMTDLDISNPYNISPAGGPASEAQLTGTVNGLDEPATAVVTLRLKGNMFYMEPIELIDVAPEHTDAVTRAYTLELDTRKMPLGAQADMVHVVGGSIQFVAQRRNVTLTEADLSPVPAASQPADK